MNDTTQSKNWIRIGLIVLVVSLIAGGCAYPNQFRNVSPGQPHSVLTVESPRLPFRGHLHVGALNEQPTSFWRCSDTFRIPAGATVVHATYSGWGAYSHAPLQFNAIVGHRYILRRRLSDGRDYVTLSEKEATSEHERDIGQADKRTD